VVNRTHRIVREQALEMRAKRERTRSLWLPIGIFSVLLPIILFAAWFVMDGVDMTPNGVPDASDQLMVLLIWSIPMTIVLIGLVWYQRQRQEREAR
jgi:protein-S-isoprenylcysteine O-methyltransferase Ste14